MLLMEEASCAELQQINICCISNNFIISGKLFNNVMYYGCRHKREKYSDCFIPKHAYSPLF